MCPKLGRRFFRAPMVAFAKLRRGGGLFLLAALAGAARRPDIDTALLAPYASPGARVGTQDPEMLVDPDSSWPATVPEPILINMERCVKRRANMTRTFTLAHIPLRRLNDSADAHLGDVTSDECALFSKSNLPGRGNCRDGAVGCAVSHLRAWNSSLARTPNASWQLISEDQTRLELGARPNILAAVAKVAKQNANWTTIFFSPGCHRFEKLPGGAGMRESGFGCPEQKKNGGLYYYGLKQVPRTASSHAASCAATLVRPPV